MTTSTLAPTETAAGTHTRLRDKVDARLLLSAAVLLVLFLGLFTLVQFSADGLVGNDGYYHIKMGYLIRQHASSRTFPGCR
ncbi:MAG TPA: hypothetical protein VF177_06690 [Anaerolineae bacterium]